MMTALAATDQKSLTAALLLGALLLFLLGDLLIAGLWVAGLKRGRSLIALHWSSAHLFLSLQGVLLIVLLTMATGSVALLILSGGNVQTSVEMFSGIGFYVVLLPTLLVQQIALILIPAGFVLFKYRCSLRELGLPTSGQKPWRQLLWGAGLALLLIPLVALLEAASKWLVIESGWIPNGPALAELSRETSALRLLDAMRDNVPALVLLGAIIGIIGPIAEEVFFRGFAHGVLRRRFGLHFGMLLSSGLFAAIHGNPVAFLPILLMGVVLAWLYERTGNLAAPIGLHCANNLLALLLYLVAPDFNPWDWMPSR